MFNALVYPNLMRLQTQKCLCHEILIVQVVTRVPHQGLLIYCLPPLDVTRVLHRDQAIFILYPSSCRQCRERSNGLTMVYTASGTKDGLNV